MGSHSKTKTNKQTKQSKRKQKQKKQNKTKQNKNKTNKPWNAGTSGLVQREIRNKSVFSAQNVAENSLLFFYRHSFDDISARKPRKCSSKINSKLQVEFVHYWK